MDFKWKKHIWISQPSLNTQLTRGFQHFLILISLEIRFSSINSAMIDRMRDWSSILINGIVFNKCFMLPFPIPISRIISSFSFSEFLYCCATWSKSSLETVFRCCSQWPDLDFLANITFVSPSSYFFFVSGLVNIEYAWWIMLNLSVATDFSSSETRSGCHFKNSFKIA